MIDRDDIKQLLDDLVPLIQRFPDLPVSNVSYNRNFIELLFNLYRVDEQFADYLADLRPQQTMRAGIRYQEHGDAVYDRTRLKRLNRLLHEDYQPLRHYLGGYFQSVEADLVKLKRSTDFDSLAKKLIRISPLVYTAAGEALTTPHFTESLSLEPDELQLRYYDTFNVHLSSLFNRLSERQGYGEVRRFVANVSNQFIPKEVIPATTRYTSTSQQISERELFLEEIPPLYTPLRGALARDCSMVTVPYFGILKNTRVFWVNRSCEDNAKPSGYLFVAEVKLDDVMLPYVITINGLNLDATDCSAICYLLQDIYQSQSVLIADVAKVSYLVNSLCIADAMVALGGKKVSINMPSGWQAISDWSVNTVAYQNYYDLSRLTQPRIVSPEKLSLYNPRITHAQVANHYPKNSIDEVSLLNRTIIGYYFLRSPDIGINEEILMPLLSLEKEHFQHSDEVIDLYQGGVFKVESFQKLKDYFGFTFKDYAELPFSIRVASLADLYREFGSDPSIHHQQWRAVCRKTFDELKAIVAQGFLRGNRDTILQQMASIPDEFIDEYWEVIAPCFMVDTNRLDFFVLRLLVKHFQSPHTVTCFLEFIDEHPEAAEAIKPEDPRWFDYLTRASAIAAEHEALSRLLQRLFHDQPLNLEISMSAYEVEQRYQAARALGWPVRDSLVNEVYQKRGWL
jgi:hypothetical protein